MRKTDEKLMREAIRLAKKGMGRTSPNPVVGAVIVRGGKIIASGYHKRAGDNHAEVEALAMMRGRAREDDVLYVTLEPCPMCAAAIALARIRRLHFGAYDAKGGGVDHGPRIFDQTTCHHRPEVIGGVDETRCAELLKRFFRDRRRDAARFLEGRGFVRRFVMTSSWMGWVQDQTSSKNGHTPQWQTLAP